MIIVDEVLDNLPQLIEDYGNVWQVWKR